MEIKDRLQMLIAHFASSQSDFAEKISVTRATISHILSGRNGMSADVTNKIIKTFPSVTYQWIQSGEGISPIESLNESELPFTQPAKNVFDDSKKSDTPPSQTDLIAKNENIEKIVFFYKDGTFKVFNNET